MGDDQRGRSRWHGPDGLAVTVVRLAGAHRVMAKARGLDVDRADRDGRTHAFVVTRRGALETGGGYYATVGDLARAVDLSLLGD